MTVPRQATRQPCASSRGCSSDHCGRLQTTSQVQSVSHILTQFMLGGTRLDVPVPYRWLSGSLTGPSHGLSPVALHHGQPRPLYRPNGHPMRWTWRRSPWLHIEAAGATPGTAVRSQRKPKALLSGLGAPFASVVTEETLVIPGGCIHPPTREASPIQPPSGINHHARPPEDRRHWAVESMTCRHAVTYSTEYGGLRTVDRLPGPGSNLINLPEGPLVRHPD